MTHSHNLWLTAYKNSFADHWIFMKVRYSLVSALCPKKIFFTDATKEIFTAYFKGLSQTNCRTVADIEKSSRKWIMRIFRLFYYTWRVWQDILWWITKKKVKDVVLWHTHWQCIKKIFFNLVRFTTLARREIWCQYKFLSPLLSALAMRKQPKTYKIDYSKHVKQFSPNFSCIQKIWNKNRFIFMYEL